MDFEQLANSLNLSRERLQGVTRTAGRVALVVAVAYIGASFVSGFVMSSMLTKAVTAFNQMSRKRVTSASMSLGNPENYHSLEKAIKERNLFNSTGEFPDERDPEEVAENKASSFDINAACAKPTINVDLVGTIYLGDHDSVATLQEKGYSEADVYREGDAIIGNEQVSVAKIERNRVILNNNGVKECLELKVEGPKRPPDGFPNVSPSAVPGADARSDMPSAGGDCNFDEKYVQDELGPGFGTIIQKARLVPNTTDNQMNGFKIFAIDQSSLLGKTGLQNGDVITQVNETSLKQPEQGFALYQAFQDDKEVRIQILRKGTTPMMITCRIK